MRLIEQAAARVALAQRLTREPVNWVVSAAVLEELRAAGAGERLAGLPVEPGQPRSEWGLDLVLAP